ncbi:POL3-like protein [Mya arenaria]|uniref:POL3-like protein n=1 Tax=Mya arenaria TaxID=6604 RepID=A0ABY7G933_MYAAR|nr:POL3-like protein [Mya arenaria]
MQNEKSMLIGPKECRQAERPLRSRRYPGGSTIFSSFILNAAVSGYQLRRSTSRKYGHYEIVGMPFGVNKTSGTFHRAIELSLQGLQSVTCLVYIDDIVVFGQSFQKNITRAAEV